MTKAEALKLALEALDCICSPLHVREITKVGNAMKAIKEALAQPDQEPVACPFPCGWKRLFEIIVADGAFLARSLEEGEAITEHQREVVMQMIGYAKDMALHGMKAIREALAQSDQESDDLTIAYMAGFYDGKNKDAPQPEQEPVAWGGDCVLGHCGSPAGCEGSNCCRANYTTPPQRKPLTDEQIFDLSEPFGAFQYGDAQGHKRLEFARAIEAAHGIKGESVQQGVAEGSENPVQAATNALNTIIGCFEAAEVEGLSGILANTQDERLKDLVERRLMYAYITAQETLAAHGIKE
ncbi:hypothetical protein UFOVP577_28 [uncultured Caudovirales phage]|uniref:Uncharacterized protein n=1 Tax=uncultured Caudovirales phage TaxID=2100421 RepID=A0A6J5MVN7_9CAUD|nr:hypothetical protein UFOVP577_28 [uncultured Caudovirales phage]